MAMSENKARMFRGDLAYAFTPEMVNARRRCGQACTRYNNAGEFTTRRRQVEMWKESALCFEKDNRFFKANDSSIINDKTPLPPPAETEEADEELFAEEAWVEPPIHIDYGTNVELGDNVFLNFNTTIVDTCKVKIGARTLFGPNVSLYAGGHPLDPEVRNGTKGPEYGGAITIEEDCWIGGNVTVLPNVTIGKGSTIGAAAVVTKVR